MTFQDDEYVQSGLRAEIPPPPPLSPRLRRRNVFQMPVLQNVEDVSMYGPGGYHPTNLGDVIRHRSKIIHKLGNGGFALVWLARDLVHGQNVALKILKADDTSREIRVLEHLGDVAGNIRITGLRETFTIEGPNGSHQCLVLELGGSSVGDLTLCGYRPPLPFLHVAAKSLAKCLASIHAAGICHGDLAHSNVLFEITNFQDWTEDEVYQHLGRPKIAPLLLIDGTPAPVFAPTHVVDALDYSNLNIKHLSGNVFISDFGESFFVDNVPIGLGTPASFSAPELLFGYQPSCAVDLWALGCLIFEIYTSRVLIPTIFGSDQEALALAIETIGALPEKWQYSYCDKDNLLQTKDLGKKHRWFDNQLQRTRTLDSQLINHLPELTHDRRATFLQLLESMLTFEPRYRLPATEIAVHL